jgi:AraC family transcriptional regulator
MGSLSPEAVESRAISDASTEAQLSWISGSVLMRTQSADRWFQRDFLRSDLAMGFLFMHSGSEVTWRLDGKQALAKVWSPTAASHEMVIVPPGCEFAGRCEGGGQGLWLFIDPESVVGDHRVEVLTKKPSVDGSWVKDRLAWMILSEIRKECANGFPRGPMFLENAAAVFVSQLGYVLYDAPRVEPSRALSDAKLAIVIEYVETNLHRNITLTELANLVDFTPRYFCAAFKEATGRPPHQFQIERRIERAKALLHNPNVSLTEVALGVGFSSQSHLNDYFRRIVGVTPARYRAEARPNGAAANKRPALFFSGPASAQTNRCA